MSADVETIVVGAGAIGLAVARALALAGRDVLVLERHRRIGAETSSRNSEVIHAGLYYPPGSLRARLCVAGRDLLYRFAADNGVAAHRLGKLLVATSDDEIGRLDAIRRTAEANGVTDLVPLDAAAARRLEPEIICAAALLSPSTGVIDSAGLMQALEGHVIANGGSVVLDTAVETVSRDADGAYRLATRSAADDTAATITCRRLVLAAGLGGTALADTVSWPASGYRPPRTYPTKGHYFSLAGRAPFSRLVYPMPQGAWLGIHLTLDVGGQAKFGPDLDHPRPSQAGEWGNPDSCSAGFPPPRKGEGNCEADYAFDDPNGARAAKFACEIRRYWPGLADGALLPAYTGIRPRIYAPGQPVADFAIHGPAEHGAPGLVALYGIESPGLTSCLAIADHVARLIEGGAA